MIPVRRSDVLPSPQAPPDGLTMPTTDADDRVPAGFVPARIGLLLSLVLFGIPGLGLWLSTHLLIPRLVARGVEPLAAWFAAGSLIFVPLFGLALAGAALSGPDRSAAAILERLRVRRMSAADWKLAGIALLVTLAGIAALTAVNAALWRLPTHPPFMAVEPLTAAQYWLFGLWMPFFFFNIVGEEIWWRGFIQPRQEPVFGQWTWVVQGLLHGAFHVSFGAGVLLLLVPVVFAIPWAVQRSRNTSVGIAIHAGVNGPGFLAVTLGLVPA
jgi:membrane protease YdiL (CAAX protease family)